MPPRIPTIPRFLLPQRGSIWTQPSLSIRNASHKAPKKPLVLEKPARFNPPSHGAKQAKGPPRYLYPGPQLSAEQAAAQKTKKYPTMMPPEGSFMHWFLHNRAIHLWITLVRFFSSSYYTAFWLRIESVLIICVVNFILYGLFRVDHKLQARFPVR